MTVRFGCFELCLFFVLLHLFLAWLPALAASRPKMSQAGWPEAPSGAVEEGEGGGPEWDLPAPPLVVRGAPRSAERAEGFRHLGFDRPRRQICARQPGRPQPRRPAPGPRYPAAAGLGPPANASPPALFAGAPLPPEGASWGPGDLGRAPSRLKPDGVRFGANVISAQAVHTEMPRTLLHTHMPRTRLHICPETGCT